MSNETTYRTRTKGKRKQFSNPYGDRETSQRVTAVLGKKPNWASWKQYHGIAQSTPWKLDEWTANHAPAVLARRTLAEPSRALTERDKQGIKDAHDDLRAGTIDAAGYLDALDALAAGIVPAKRRRPAVGA